LKIIFKSLITQLHWITFIDFFSHSKCVLYISPIIVKVCLICHLSNCVALAYFMFLILMKIVAFVYLCSIVFVYCLYKGEDVLSWKTCIWSHCHVIGQYNMFKLTIKYCTKSLLYPLPYSPFKTKRQIKRISSTLFHTKECLTLVLGRDIFLLNKSDSNQQQQTTQWNCNQQ
jgi:hypothetical protein